MKGLQEIAQIEAFNLTTAI